MYGGAPDSFQTENSCKVEPGISLTEVPVLTTKLLSVCINRQLKTMRVLIDNGKIEHIKDDSSGNQKFFIYKRPTGKPDS